MEKEAFEEIVSKLNEEQREILTELGELGKKEQELMHIIDKTHQNIEVIGFEKNRAPIMISQDQDFVHLLTIGPLSELLDIRKNIKDKLNKALNLGLGDLGVVQRASKIYGIAK